MNESSELPLALGSTPDTRPCSITSIIPSIGMSSCRGRAEAFARSLSSKLRTLGSQASEDSTAAAEDEPIINGISTANTWVHTHEDGTQTVTNLQPLRHESDSFFDFDCELESPGSPVDECEYLRLIETASNTPHNSTTESGYACASIASSHSSSDGPYFDALAAATAAATNGEANVTIKPPKLHKLPATEVPHYVNALKLNGSQEHITNGVAEHDVSVEVTAKEAAAQTLPVTGPDELDSAACMMFSPPIARATSPTIARSPSPVPHYMSSIARTPSPIAILTPRTASPLATSPVARAASPLPASPVARATSPIAILTRNAVARSSSPLALSPSARAGSPIVMSIQEQILSELHEQSEKFNESHNGHSFEEADNTNNTSISNGSAENVEENLKIAVAENEKNESNEETAKEPTTAVEANAPKSNSNHTLDTTDDEDDCRPQRVRRCSSLKTGKTPPGTPGRKKIVRFADVLGLDLADVKTFLDEIPTIPKSAFEDLEVLETEPPMQLGPKSDKMLMPLFQQPGGLPAFLDLVREKQVSLENAAVTDNINQTITGTVRVRNLDFHKSVHIRYSLDGWRSFADLQANYVENSCDGFSDKFSFMLFGNSLHVGQRLELAVRFQCKGQQFWDNNYGINYCFQCLPSSNRALIASPTTPAAIPAPTTTQHTSDTMMNLLSPAAGETWCSSFY